jgi:hypothetical protein
MLGISETSKKRLIKSTKFGKVGLGYYFPLASADNMRAGRMLSVSYVSYTNDIAYPANGMLRTKMVAASAVADGAIVSRDTDVSVSVSAVFEIK